MASFTLIVLSLKVNTECTCSSLHLPKRRNSERVASDQRAAKNATWQPKGRTRTVTVQRPTAAIIWPEAEGATVGRANPAYDIRLALRLSAVVRLLSCCPSARILRAVERMFVCFSFGFLHCTSSSMTNCCISETPACHSHLCAFFFFHF